MRTERVLATCGSAALALWFGCGAPDAPFDAPACATLVTTGQIAVVGEDNYDLLFVVDDSPSMAEEQASLQRELPALVQRFLDGGDTGTRSSKSSWFINAHIGVVSADLGTAGVADAHPGCSARGDDGLLRHAVPDAACNGALPQFLSYGSRPQLGIPPLPGTPPSSQSVAADFACIARPAAEGCGYAQPLESALEALGATKNVGFLRSEPRNGLSLVGIVIVTDQDDCSVADPRFFADPAMAEASPAARCAASSEALFPVARYVERLRALRAGNEQLVMLSVIAGMPEELVATVPEDFADNPATRDQFYDALLSDTRMQPSPRPDGTLTPACQSEGASAAPAPRLVELARGFGGNATVLSICQDDWSRAIDWMLQVTARQLGVLCFPRPLVRSSVGLVSCDIVWELPTADLARTDTPTRCDEVPALLTLDTHHPVGERAGQRCVVRQLAVTGPPDARVVEPGFGWYYDDFSDDVQHECTTSPKQKIEFTPGAEPPLGVQPSYACAETQPLAPAVGDIEEDEAFLTLFDACDPSIPEACARLLRDRNGFEPSPIFDRSLVCHPEQAMCVVPCMDGACPDGWNCNDGTPPFCEPGECRVPG